jgi:hypothetical protein
MQCSRRSTWVSVCGLSVSIRPHIDVRICGERGESMVRPGQVLGQKRENGVSCVDNEYEGSALDRELNKSVQRLKRLSHSVPDRPQKHADKFSLDGSTGLRNNVTRLLTHADGNET